VLEDVAWDHVQRPVASLVLKVLISIGISFFCLRPKISSGDPPEVAGPPLALEVPVLHV